MRSKWSFNKKRYAPQIITTLVATILMVTMLTFLAGLYFGANIGESQAIKQCDNYYLQNYKCISIFRQKYKTNQLFNNTTNFNTNVT